VLVAAISIAVGFAFDAGTGTRELTSVFAGCYAVGSLLAVLAVRQAAVFTAVIQPPLLLFVAVPSAYFLFHSSEIRGLKDLAINCGYPLIERFPLMFFVSAAVLVVGMVRWYVGMSSRRGTATPEATSAKAAKKPAAKAKPAGGLLGAVTSKLAETPDAVAADDDELDDVPPRRPRTADRPRRATKPAAERRSDSARDKTGRKPAKRTGTTSRSRRDRAPETEIIEPVVDRPRRTRSSSASRAGDAPEPRRRPREPREPREARESREPRERKSPPSDRRSTYERPERPERRRRYDDYEPLEPHSNGNGSSSHHPVSRVRYRGADDGDERAEYRSPSRARRSWEADRWEYDI
jgi:hypothetical protein